MENSRMHERIIGLYEKNAAAWDAVRGRDARLERKWLERFAALLPADGKVLDLGCGAGQPIARWLIGRGLRVTGVDSSPSLIAICRERFPGLCVARRRHARAGAGRAVRRPRRLAQPVPPRARRPASHVPALRGPCEAGRRPDVHQRLGGGVRIGEWQGEPLYHASLDPGEYRRLLAGVGFETVAREDRDPECGEATVWIARYTANSCPGLPEEGDRA